MNRREFAQLLSGAAVAWPLTAHAQQKAMPVVGFLSGGSPDSSAPYVMAFHEGLSEAGYVEGRNVAIEFRWQEGRYERAPILAAELVDHGVAVIVASGGPASAFAAKAATTTIPIVFVSGTDPVKARLVGSFNHPRGNITGVTFFAATLAAKRLELPHETFPQKPQVACPSDPNN